MNNNVVNLRPNINMACALMNIAEEIQNGNIAESECTLIIGTDVYHLGCIDDREAAVNAVFNMTYGIQKLMRPAVDASLEDS